MSETFRNIGKFLRPLQKKCDNFFPEMNLRSSLLFLNVSTSKSNADRYCVPLFVFPVLFCSCAMRYYISIHIYRTAGNWRVTNDRQQKLLLQTHKGCHHSNGVAELV